MHIMKYSLPKFYTDKWIFIKKKSHEFYVYILRDEHERQNLISLILPPILIGIMLLMGIALMSFLLSNSYN